MVEGVEVWGVWWEGWKCVVGLEVCGGARGVWEAA